MGKLCVGKLCVSKLCVSKLCVGGRREEEEEEAGGSAQPKTRTPHKDAGNNNHPKETNTKQPRLTNRAAAVALFPPLGTKVHETL